MDYNMTGIEGTISEINERGILVEGTSIYEGYDESIILHLDPKIKIVDQQGTTLASSDLEVGMSIKSFYGPAVALSMPPQSTTNYIQVQTEAGEPEHEVPAGTEGIVTNVEDGKVTVIGSPLETGGVNYVILTVDKDTEIVDGDGKPLTADALKESVRVEAFYGQVMTMIYPAQTHADKIVVSEVSAPKIEGTITATERATKDQLYINVGSDQNTNNDVILNISEDTQVITPLGFEAELKPGTKIVAYHSPVMTKSLPPITAAEVILVQSEE
ncbi:probable sugar O-acetyltransferase [Paenibacillus sp. JCM 10914]|nr:probable sugar O-acetyltransferase [Paenibacillus sp. JCM 10914]